MERATIGRSVHYIDATGAHNAAIVTVEDKDQTGRVSLMIFSHLGGMLFKSNVPCDQERLDLESWHWPERV